MVLGKSYNFEKRILRDIIIDDGESDFLIPSNTKKKNLESLYFNGIFDFDKKRTILIDRGDLGDNLISHDKLDIIGHYHIESYCDTFFGCRFGVYSYNVLDDVSVYYKLDISILKEVKNYKNLNDLYDFKKEALLLPIYDSNHLKRVFNSVKKIEFQLKENCIEEYCNYVIDNKKHNHLLSELNNELGKYLPYSK